MRSPTASTLIIGADGFLGANLVDYFAERGWAYHAIRRADGDLTDADTVQSLFRTCPPVDRIFHLVTRQRTGAGQYGLQGELLAINSRIHLNILDAWRLHQPQAKLISTGSSCAYPESAAPLPESAFHTGTVHPSVHGYALAKRLLAVGSACYGDQYKLSWLHCVLATMYGPKDHKAPDRSHFMGAMVDRAVRERAAGSTRFTVWGSLETVRDLLHVEDQIEAILAADAVFDNELLNCTAGRQTRIGDAARTILEALDWDVPIETPPGSFQGTGFKMLDSTRFLDRTGWTPRISLLDGTRRLLRSDYGIG